MAKYKTTVHVPDQYVATNAKGFVKYTSPVQFPLSHEMKFEIRDLDDIVDLSTLDAHYYYWDRKKEHPFYVTNTFAPKKDLMIICGEDDAGILGLDSPLNTTKYGLISPYNVSGTTKYNYGIDSYFKSIENGEEVKTISLSDFIKSKTVGDNIVFAAKTSNAKKQGDFLVIDGINAHESSRFDENTTQDFYSIANRKNGKDIYKVRFPNCSIVQRQISYNDNVWSIRQNIYGAHAKGMTAEQGLELTVFMARNPDWTESTNQDRNLIIPFLDSLSEGNTAGIVSFPYLGYTFAKKGNEYYFLWCYNLEGSGYDYLVWSIMAVKDICLYRSGNNAIYFDGVTKLGDYYCDPVRSIEYLLFGDNAPTPTPDNPYEDENKVISGGGDPYKDKFTNTSQGGNGSYDDTKETFTHEPLPISSAVTNNYIACYWLNSTTETRDLLGMITDTLFKITSPDWHDLIDANIMKTREDRISQGIQRLFLLPFTNPGPFETARFYIGGVPIWNGNESNFNNWVTYNDINVQTPVVPKLTGGTVQLTLNYPTITHYYDNFLDYSPYTSTTIFIPFVGIQSVPTNQVYDVPIKVIYNVNSSNGDFVAFLYIDGLLYATFGGNMAYDMQLSFYNSNTVLDTIANNIANKVPVKAYQAALDAVGINDAIALGEASIQVGQTSKNASWLMGNQGWISQEIPKVAIPEEYSKHIGYTTKMESTLQNLHGFCKVEEIHLRCSATDAEREEIERLLKEGVQLP